MILAELTADTKLSHISLVKRAANKTNALKLSEEPIVKFSLDEERQEITSAVLIPNQQIYRSAEYFEKTLGINEDGHIFCTADTIKQFAIEYLNEGNRINLEHSEDTNDVQIVEQWIINTEEDKAYAMGFSRVDCPQNTWMQTQKVSDELWLECKDGTYNGFSIQGSPVMKVISGGLDLSDDVEDKIVEVVVEVLLQENLNKK